MGRRRALLGAALALRYATAHPGCVRALLYLCGTGIGHAWKRAYREERRRRLTAEQFRRRNELKAKGEGKDGAEEHEYRTLSWATDYADRGRALALAAEEAEESMSARFRINERCNATLNAEVDAEDEAALLEGCRRMTAPRSSSTGSATRARPGRSTA
jgi:proline iminopeptidase